MYYSDNLVLKTLSSLKYNLFIAIGSKYDINAYDTPIKSAVWHTFESTLYLYRRFLDLCTVFCNFYCIVYVFFYFAALWRNK